MNPTRNRRKNKRTGSELEVKEVIVPLKSDQEDACFSGSVGKDQEGYECRRSATQNFSKSGEQEITAFHGLVVLNKPPIEDYVLGIRKKKSKKKKKHNQYNPKDNPIFPNLFLETNETVQKNEEAKDLSLTLQAYEENHTIERKIQKYEKLVKLQWEMNYIKQRHLEKQSLEKQENLAETWLGFIQRRKELKNRNLEQNISSKKGRYNRPINISLALKKYWNDETGKKISENTKRKEKDEQTSLPVELDELKDVFFEKLTFFDDSDEDDNCI